MRERADRDCGDLLEIACVEDLHHVLGADGDVGVLPHGCSNEIYVVSDCASSDRLQDTKRWTRLKRHHLAAVLERQPDLRSVGRRGNVGAEWALLLDTTDDRPAADCNDDSFGREAGADIAILPVRRKDCHARAVGHFDPVDLGIAARVEHCDIVFAADGDPDFASVGREERFMRRAPHISRVLDQICRRIDEGD